MSEIVFNCLFIQELLRINDLSILSTCHKIYCFILFFSDCVQVIANPGTYVVQARHGSNAPCGVYIAGLHNEIINVEISLVDVTCKTGGLMAVNIYFFLKKPRISVFFLFWYCIITQRWDENSNLLLIFQPITAQLYNPTAKLSCDWLKGELFRIFSVSCLMVWQKESRSPRF